MNGLYAEYMNTDRYARPEGKGVFHDPITGKTTATVEVWRRGVGDTNLVQTRMTETSYEVSGLDAISIKDNVPYVDSREVTRMHQHTITSFSVDESNFTVIGEFTVDMKRDSGGDDTAVSPEIVSPRQTLYVPFLIIGASAFVMACVLLYLLLAVMQ